MADISATARSSARTHTARAGDLTRGERASVGPHHGPPKTSEAEAVVGAQATEKRNDDSAVVATAQAIKAAVDRELDLIVPETMRPVMLAEAMRHGLLAPAKRIRSILLVMSADLFGADRAHAIRAAAAVELVHAASLVLDDLPSMDNAELRRGRQTTHRAFDEATAILAAIALLNGGYDVLAKLEGIAADRRARAIAMLCDAVGCQGLSGGQLMDLRPQQGSGLSEVEQVHRGKTGALFAAALGIGATLGAPTPAAERVFWDSGMAIGLAFQGYDDLLDVFADTAKTGKDVMADAAKPTIASVLGRAGGEAWASAQLAVAADGLAKAGHGHSTLNRYVQLMAGILTAPLSATE